MTHCMKHSLVFSADGSHTLKLADFDECYHSSNGAYNEARHIYINCGVDFLHKNCGCNEFEVFDIGLGTALNCMALLVWQQSLIAEGLPAPKICYNGIEKYPITPQEAIMLNFPEHIAGHHPEFSVKQLREWFHLIHTSPWEEAVSITPELMLKKHNGDIADVAGEYFSGTLYPHSPAVIMYDTFSPATQPHLWSRDIFKKIAQNTQAGSILTTYCSKGIVKQALREAGFTLERLQGPSGKRHILRALNTI